MKPFTIKNKKHKLQVIERLRKDLRALVLYEMEDADEECFNISSKAYRNLFGEDALDSYYEQRRIYLDKINEKNYEKNMKLLYGEDWGKEVKDF